MNSTLIKRFFTIVLGSGLLVTAGCSSTKDQGDQGATITETETETATVESINSADRIVVLKREDGKLSSYKLGPQVINFDQIAVGDVVKAKLSRSVSLFLLKDGPAPMMSSSMTVSGAAKGESPSGTAVETTDVTAKVIAVDPSYRLVKVAYEDGKKKEFKTPLGLSLKDVKKGDDVLLRISNNMAIRVDKP